VPLSIVATDTSPEVINRGQSYRGIRCECSGRGHYIFGLFGDTRASVFMRQHAEEPAVPGPGIAPCRSLFGPGLPS
jgi:hypothetical protein